MCSVTKERYLRYLEKKRRVDDEVARLRKKKVDIAAFREFLLRHEVGPDLMQASNCQPDGVNDETLRIRKEAADRKRKEAIDAKNEADSLIFQTEKSLEEILDSQRLGLW